ncbi:MAG: hypothetical protein AB1782_09795 [Cyanobacteriota bacterium]
MSKKETKKVPFDPGFSNHYPQIEDDIILQVDYASKLKAVNQRKFQLQMLENKLLTPLKKIALINYACVLYGSTIANKYKDIPAEVIDNPMLKMSEVEKESLDLSIEAKSIIELYQKLSKNITFNLKRKIKLSLDLEKFTSLYIEFVTINDHFKNLTSTNQIKLPQEMNYFNDFSSTKLEEIEERLTEIAKNGNLDELLNIS